MSKLIVIAIVSLSAAVATAQPAAAPEAAPAAPQASPGAPDEAAPMPPPDPTTPPAPDVASLRKTCADAMNADPAFAKSIIATADKQIDQRTLAAHEAAAKQIAENERHVIMAYAIMWVLAALFVVFLWRRQQVLKTELAHLRKELDAAAKEGA